MIAYLDTNAFDHLYKKIGCTSADIAELRKAIYGRRISIRPSIHTLEEILLARTAAPQAFAAQIKLTFSLANFRNLIKPCDQLLTDDIRAYAARGEAARPFLHGEMQNAVTSGIAALIESDGEEMDDDFVEVLVETRRQKERFLAGMKRAREELAPIAGALSHPPSFAEFFEQGASAVAQSFAQRAGVLEACRQRGIEGLLQIKSIRISVGAALSLIYGQTFEGWPPEIGDLRDLQHAASAAAAAETFVTDDRRLRDNLARVPLDGFNVIGLQGFLDPIRP